MKATRTYTMDARADGVAATRERIARAATALFLEHAYEDVTLAAIAKAAGVSHQTVLNHFESKEGVVARASPRSSGTETLSARYDAEPGDVAGAVRALVGDYERMGDANVRWAAVAERLADAGRAARRGPAAATRQWLVAMFGDRLPATPGRPAARRARAARRDRRLHAGSCSAATCDLSRTETEKTMADLVAGILEGTNR